MPVFFDKNCAYSSLFHHLCYLNDGESHVDTNCYLMTRRAFAVILEWALIPHDLHVIGDRVVWNKIKSRKIACAHSWRATLCYRASTREDYWITEKEPPAELRGHRTDTRAAFETLVGRGGPDLADTTTKAEGAEVRKRVEIVAE